MSVLVTGASGYIGQVLCRTLKRQKYQIRAVLRRKIDGPWTDQVKIDLASEPIGNEIFKGTDTVFHLMGKAHALKEGPNQEDEYREINVEVTRKLLRAAEGAGVQRFVFFSSVKAMGENTDGLTDENFPCHPRTPYGRSKWAAEQLVLRSLNIPHRTILRLCLVYGGEVKGNLLRMIQAIAKGLFPPLPDVPNKRSMVHVEDVARAAILAAEKPAAAGGVYIISDGRAYSTRQIYEWICRELGKDVPSYGVPLTVLSLAGKIGDVVGKIRGSRFVFDSVALEKLVRSACYSNARICRELDFKPRWNLEQAMPEMVKAALKV